LSEFLHLASVAVREEAGAVGVPVVEMQTANPMAVAAVFSDVDDAFVWAVVVAAGVNCHHVVCSLLAFSALIWRLPSLALTGFTTFAGAWFAVLAAFQ
jgi:hypothetical protein